MPMTVCDSFLHSSSLTRRELLRLGRLPLFGMSLSSVLAGQARLAGQTMAGELSVENRMLTSSFGKAKRCILLFMWGGPSQLETWDLKPDAPSEVRGEFQPIQTKVPGIHISEHFPSSRSAPISCALFAR